MSVQSLNGDSYQGAQVGANVQSQVGTQPMCRQVNALRVQGPSVGSALPASVQTERDRERCRDKTLTDNQTKTKTTTVVGNLVHTL